MLLKEKTDIIAWLDKYEVKNYTLRADNTYGYVVDVADYVYLANQNLTKIAVKFGYVSGDFFCDDNQLTSLEGSPHRVGGYFWGNHNQLISLEGIPESIGGYFYCHENPELGELQDITDFNEIKVYLLSKKLAMELADDLNNQKNNRKIKL